MRQLLQRIKNYIVSELENDIRAYRIEGDAFGGGYDGKEFMCTDCGEYVPNRKHRYCDTCVRLSYKRDKHMI